jgi:hypothetical protein
MGSLTAKEKSLLKQIFQQLVLSINGTNHAIRFLKSGDVKGAEAGMAESENYISRAEKLMALIDYEN